MCFEKGLRRSAALALLLAATLVVAGCDGGDSAPVNSVPTVIVSEPQADVNVANGTDVTVTYTDNDPDDVATTSIYADLDGNLATTGDQFLLGASLDEQDGTPRSVTWDTANVPEGAYFIVIVTNDGVNPAVTTVCPGKVYVWKAWPRDHTNILLRDRQGNAIQLGSAEPFSQRETCGTCHDVDEIGNGYHFQQGRTDATGAIVTKDDYFNDGRDWLKSAGMYGKW